MGDPGALAIEFVGAVGGLAQQHEARIADAIQQPFVIFGTPAQPYGGVLPHGRSRLLATAARRGAAAPPLRDRRRHQDGARRRKRNAGSFVRHRAAAPLDQQNLEQVAMAMRQDHPVVDHGSRSDRVDMNEINRLFRRLVVETQERKRRSGHAKS